MSVQPAAQPRRWMVFALCGYIVFMAVQDTSLAILLQFLPSAAIRALVLSKDFLIIFLIVSIMLSRRIEAHRVGVVGLSVTALALLVIVYAGAGVGSGISATAVLASARSVLVPVALVVTGRLLAPTEPELRLLIGTVIGVSVASVLFGFAERFLLGDSLWVNTVGLPDYLRTIKSISIGLRPDVGLPWNFWYGDSLGTLRRMAGLHASPLTLGYALIFPVSIAVAALLIRARSILPIPWTVLAAVMGLGLLLTISRLAIASVAVTIVLVTLIGFVQTRRMQSERARYLGVGAALILFCGAAAALFAPAEVSRVWEATLSLEDNSGAYRLPAVTSSWEETRERVLVGAGFGTAGAWAQSLTGETATAESAYMALIYQSGVLGLAFFIIPFLWSIWSALSIHDEYRYVRRAVAAASLTLLATGLLSEQIFAVTSTGAQWLLLGALSVAITSVRAPQAAPAAASGRAARRALQKNVRYAPGAGQR